MMLATNYDTFNTCAHQYRGRFQASARRVLRDPAAAQDAVQDAMVAAVRHLPRFRGDSRLSTWIGRIVINQAISRRRAMSRRPESSLEEFIDECGPRGRQDVLIARTEPGPERTLLRREARALLRGALEDISPGFRTIVIMRHFEGASMADIASRLGISPNAAKLRLLRAHRRLRVLLADRGYDPTGARS